MTSKERTETDDTDPRTTPTAPSSSCCGVDFAALGMEGPAACSPSSVMADMARHGSEESGTTAPCPMAKMCSGMLKGRTGRLSLLVLIPAAVLLALGAAILVAPEILTWFVAGGFICAGTLLLVMAYQARKLGKRAL